MNTAKTMNTADLPLERSRIAPERSQPVCGTSSLTEDLDCLERPSRTKAGTSQPESQSRQLTRRYPASKTDPFEDLLVKLADLVLGEDELHTEWLNMVKLARLCRTHKLYLHPGKQGCKEMDYYCRVYFDQRWDIRRDGVKITWRTEDMEHGDEFQVRFHRLDPANDLLPNDYFYEQAHN